MNKTLISVIIPTYNRSSFISRAIESVLDQTYQYFEIIIVDDCSTDNTRHIVSTFSDERIKYIEHINNMGAPAARNTGITNSKGKWIAFLDSDDVWNRNKLEEQVKIIPSLSDEYAVIHCGAKTIDFNSGKILTERITRVNINNMIRYNVGVVPPTPTMMIRKNVLLEVGLFDDNLPAHQETELCIRIAQKYKFKLVDQFLVTVTRNHNQIRGNPQAYIRAKEIILEKHKALLSDELIYNFCNIIAGYYIINKEYNIAKKYLRISLTKKVKTKSILSYSLLNIFPALTNSLYLNSYKKRGIV